MKQRLIFIDVIRAYAICMMLQGHFITALLGEPYWDESNIYFHTWHYFTGITAPVFLTIFGFVTINEGVKVHKKTCPNAISMQSNYAYRVIPAKWVKSDERDFKVSLRISGIDRDGLISDISKVILDSKFVKLTNINIDTEGNVFNGKVSISINNNATLKKLMLDIKNVKGVDKVTRL